MTAQHPFNLPQLHRLLSHLSAEPQPAGEEQWKPWHIEVIGGGMNNRLFRATLEDVSLAVKFTRQDGRDRAGREWNALCVLQEAGLSIAPAPILLERDRYAHPVVVQSWLEGTVADEPPTQDDNWDGLLAHLHTIHSLPPDSVRRPLPRTVLTMKSADEALDAIGYQRSLLPAAGWTKELGDLLEAAERIGWPDWPPVTETLCRADPSIRNFVQPRGRGNPPWKSVDWEYSGWCDPAFEIADLIVHPSYAAVPESRWEWVIERYCGQSADAGVEERIRVYRALMLVWWRVRLARYLSEHEHESATRLASLPDGWQEEKRRQMADYSVKAFKALSAF